MHYIQLVILDGVSSGYKERDVLFTNCLGYYFLIKIHQNRIKIYFFAML
jgi:hypothetical protein